MTRFPFPCPKIESEEYEEALSLAQTYGLDTDLVYQRQWRRSAVSSASIQNYLVRTMAEFKRLGHLSGTGLHVRVLYIAGEVCFPQLGKVTLLPCFIGPEAGL